MSCIPGGCDSTCVSFNHSGGPGNCDPCLDLGGPLSLCPITMGLDNLFHSIGPKLSRKGHEDYRCFYVYNSGTFILKNATIYMDGTGNQTPGKNSGAYHAIGVKLQDEIQQITVFGALPPVVGEYMELTVPGYGTAFKVYYDPNITKWVGNFQTAIRGVKGLSEVVVTVGDGDAVGAPTNVTFTIYYGGYTSRDGPMPGHKGTTEHSKWNQAAKHQIDLITIGANTMSNVTAIPVPVQEGSPVNTTAISTFPDETMAPTDVVFSYYFRGNPIRVGNLAPGEFVPIWIRRTLPFPDPAFGNLAKWGQMAKLVDDFTIKVEATSP